MLTSRSVAGTRVTSLPPMRICPLVAISRPAMSRRVVVFPQPDGPRRVTSVPAATVNETSRTATTGPYALVTRRNSTEAEWVSRLKPVFLEAHLGGGPPAQSTPTDDELNQ